MQDPNQPRSNDKSHMPANSALYEKVIPAALVLMGILTVALILFAAFVLLGVIHL
ncbi:MAG: hypothetical protein M1282_06185 [Chloroflexi bacterium]|nr:hypothetical protein [Chloroflexota bacterium]